MNTIFVLARTTGGNLIESYCDYNHMVSISGYDTCELSEIDYQSDNIYIWSTHIGNPTQVFMHAKAKERKCKLVFWNLEWPNWENGNLIGFEGSDFLGIEEHVDEMWISDKYLYGLLCHFKPHANHKFRFVFFGGHPDFGNKDDGNRKIKYDCAHFMYLTGVRGFKFNFMRDVIKIVMAPNTFIPEERNKILLQSRWGLHLHQNSLACISPQRFMLFASFSLPIITDYVQNPFPYEVFQDGLVHFDPRKSSVMNDSMRRNAVEYNYYLVTDKHSFKKEVDRASSWLSRKK